MSDARSYAVVTATYWAFTLTDGALRTLILLHFNRLGFTPLQLSSLFLLYEVAGVVANVVGGWLATRFGIPRMLMTGTGLQVIGIVFLAALDPTWRAPLSVAWVVLAQGVAGIAKDVTKTAAKSALKATSAGEHGRLFRWVAWFTGSKNAMKGVGFFLGGLLLQRVGFRPALGVMAVALLVVLLVSATALPRTLGKAKASKSVRELFAKSRAINLMAAARLCLFGARDVWFVVGLPLFLYAQGWQYREVAGFLALWTIGYGGVQALAPRLVRRGPDGFTREVVEARVWSGVLVTIPVAIAFAMRFVPAAAADLAVAAGLSAFGFAFAVMSSLHSYLVLAYAGSEKAAEDVGFYYAANAGGRLLGTMLSGTLFQFDGLTGCLIGSSIMLGLCFGLTWALPGGYRSRPA